MTAAKISLILSWLLLTISGATDENNVLTAPSSAPKPVSWAFTVPTWSVITNWVNWRNPPGNVTNWPDPMTRALLTAMLILPSPETGTVMIPCNKLALVLWSPIIKSSATLMSKLIFRLVTSKSRSFIHMFFWPVNWAFVNKKSMLKISMLHNKKLFLALKAYVVSSVAESSTIWYSSTKKGSTGFKPESGHPQGKFSLSRCKNSMIWSLIVLKGLRP